MENKKILFVDMDGVLADFEKGLQGDFSRMYKRGFFRNLEVMENDLNQTFEEIQAQGITVKILSKACVRKSHGLFKVQMMDKVNWIKEHIPCIDELNITIQATDESKGAIVDMYKGHECYLIDDYSKNLAEWVLAGGKAIKRAKRIKNDRKFRQVLNVSELAIEGI